MGFSFAPFPSTETEEKKLAKGLCRRVVWSVSTEAGRNACPSCSSADTKCPSDFCDVKVCYKHASREFSAWPYSKNGKFREYYYGAGGDFARKLGTWDIRITCTMSKITVCQNLYFKACNGRADCIGP